MSDATLKAVGADRFVLSGPVVFATAGELLEASRSLFEGRPTVTVDLAGVSNVDSAALALMLEWLRQARTERRQILYTGMPQKLRAIARLSGVEDILATGDHPSGS